MLQCGAALLKSRLRVCSLRLLLEGSYSVYNWNAQIFILNIIIDAGFFCHKANFPFPCHPCFLPIFLLHLLFSARLSSLPSFGLFLLFACEVLQVLLCTNVFLITVYLQIQSTPSFTVQQA